MTHKQLQIFQPREGDVIWVDFREEYVVVLKHIDHHEYWVEPVNLMDDPYTLVVSAESLDGYQATVWYPSSRNSS